ncbi:MAG: TolC family protein [Ignavibacteriae bacterium]|nr:TolC family protein [Ignavibacteriota bacterium]NOG98392.1 TolC family protein [Ignavibacteriota bacterium]
MNKLVITSTLLLTFFINISAQKLNINSFIELVKKNNKDILIAVKDLEAAEATEDEARSNAFPQINAKADYSRNLKDSYLYVVFPNPQTGVIEEQKFKMTYKNNFNLQAALSQQIFNATVFNAIKAAKQYAKLSDYIYDATIDGVITGSKKAFYQTLLLREVWEVSKAAEESAEENYESIKNKFDQGLVSEFQLLQAEVRWKNLMPETTKSKRNYQLALNSLKMLAGISVEKELHIEGDFSTYPAQPEKYDIETVLAQRPDFNALQWEMNLRETNISVEQSGHYPLLYGSFAYQYSSMSDQFKLERENNVLMAGLTLQIPIFSGWAVSSRVQKAEIEFDKSRLKIEKAKDEIHTEIKNLSLKLTEASNRITAAEQTLHTAEKAFGIAEASANNGLATQLELKDTRVAFDQAQLNFYSSVYDYLAAYYDWELANGMVW